MREQQPISLRTALSVSAAIIVLLAASAAVSLILATSVLQNITANVAASVESVRTVEEAELSLLLHGRAKDPVLQRELESQLRAHLHEAARHVTSDVELVALNHARVEIMRYLVLARQPGGSIGELAVAEASAFDALETLVEINLAEARLAGDLAVRWDRFANVAGVVLGLASVGITLAIVLWLRRRVIRPLFSLAATMKRFGAGQRTTRAVEEGPAELREMSQEFNAMADALAAQRQQQTAFLGGVAHDLRNPLGALKLAVELVGPEHELPPEPQLRRTLALMGRQVDQLTRMANDFLDMSKIEAGTLELQIDHHDVCSVVRDALELFETGGRQRIRLALPATPVVIPCDPLRIAQVLANLVSNALKYSADGAPIDIALTVAEDDVIVAVTDRGAGIPADDQQRIFEPFRRGSGRTTIPGTGLGLYNVRRLIEAHGGTVEVESSTAGSTFRIRLPRFVRPETRAAQDSRA
jgi:two-component system, OmpR family, sensor histidine kinase MtrB